MLRNLNIILLLVFAIAISPVSRAVTFSLDSYSEFTFVYTATIPFNYKYFSNQ